MGLRAIPNFSIFTFSSGNDLKFDYNTSSSVMMDFKVQMTTPHFTTL